MSELRVGMYVQKVNGDEPAEIMKIEKYEALICYWDDRIKDEWVLLEDLEEYPQ